MQKIQELDCGLLVEVIYSDELIFLVIRATRTIVRRPIGSNHYSSKFTVNTINYPDSVIVWGCFSAAGHGGLYFLPKNSTMNSETYKKSSGGSSDSLHADSRHDPFFSGWGTLPHEQVHQQVFGRQGLLGDPLAGQQP